MENMYSIGDLIDKLVIENIKIYKLRDSLHKNSLSDEEYVNINTKMNIINENRSVIIRFLDEKIKFVSNGGVNSYFKDVKTYES